MSLLLITILLGQMVPLEKTVAVVKDSPILHSQVMQSLMAMGEQLQGDFQTITSSPEYMDALKQLVENRLLVQAGIDAGYYPTDQEIDDLVAQKLEDDPDLQGMDQSDLRKLVAEDQAAQVFLGHRVQSAMAEMPMSPETYLRSNSQLVEEMVMPRHLEWIYLPVLPSGPDQQAAVDELLQLRDRIMAGESFEDIAMEYSDDNSAAYGGYLGTFQPETMTPAFAAAIADLQPGEISQPVTTRFGVHLIRLESREDDGRVTASHILRLVPSDSTDVAITIGRAQEILDRINSGEMSFEDAASSYSMDPSSMDGGDIGVIPVKLSMPGLVDAISELSVGSSSAPLYLEDLSAVVIVRVVDDSGNIDWGTYSDSDLNSLVQQVIYQDTYTTVVDSLTDAIPVVYLLGDDSSLED